MEFISIISDVHHHHHRRNSYNERKLTITLNKSQTINGSIDKSNTRKLSTDNFTYRTEAYLQQREQQQMTHKSLSVTPKTTWKNVMQQKRILQIDQAEIDRALLTIDSIHGSFNRSMLKPSYQVYSSLYGDDDKSTRLIKTFCQRQDHYMNYEVTVKHDDDDSNTQEISSSFGNMLDSDFDDCTEDEEEKENENEKKNSCDSGFGSVMPKRQFSRESLLKITQSLSKN
ncbi:unnamed protein product [Adineta steineri]|uniref:Uncharacterized protein n=1 Tax=Adineta steineri TaxID=433720 RepID=A0A815BDL3_9BILA|nr:unnamed protein product [Adineta steineri]CAF1558023.1 unnamed protein product [Adineta steineri]